MSVWLSSCAHHVFCVWVCDSCVWLWLMRMSVWLSSCAHHVFCVHDGGAEVCGQLCSLRLEHRESGSWTNTYGRIRIYTQGGTLPYLQGCSGTNKVVGYPALIKKHAPRVGLTTQFLFHRPNMFWCNERGPSPSGNSKLPSWCNGRGKTSSAYLAVWNFSTSMQVWAPVKYRRTQLDLYIVLMVHVHFAHTSYWGTRAHIYVLIHFQHDRNLTDWSLHTVTIEIWIFRAQGWPQPYRLIPPHCNNWDLDF
jgi:hypothetical protein